jgi:hypothetical protein
VGAAFAGHGLVQIGIRRRASQEEATAKAEAEAETKKEEP